MQPTGRQPGVRRRTRQVDETYRVLCGSRDHPSPAEVLGRVRARLPDASRATVYRNLQKLLDEGRVQRVQVGGRSSRYDARLDPHDHFHCVRCGLVCDVAVPRPGAIPRALGGHRIESVIRTFEGVCGSCAATGGRRGSSDDARRRSR